ncbi:MAG: GNAT family N-acetyltransferase [Actinomycetota bacterium]
MDKDRTRLFVDLISHLALAWVLHRGEDIVPRGRAMFVRSDWTRRGLGTRILEASESAEKSEGSRMLSLMWTLPGLPLYAKYGFTVNI